MCGIVGVVHLDGSDVPRRLVRRMLAPLGHRGPDEHGVFVDGDVALGHVRLSIIDPAGGHQPMRYAQRGLSITFNGEIYNYIELRAELQAKGHCFRTQSDTEVILHAYEEYGDDCVNHFNGQWAFALWDRPRRRMLLSRDRFGVRPLYYTTAKGKFLFASEVKSLFAHRDVRRAIDPHGLGQLFTFWSPLAPRTVFEGVCELPPGCNLSLENGQVRTDRYWRLPYDVDQRRRSADDWADELLDLLTDATRLRLRSDVPVGAYLSGGLDSTINAALVQQCTNKALHTYSVTFESPEFDETAYQRQVVDALGTQHQAIRCTRQDIAQVFPEVIWHTERPILRTAPAPLFLLSELVHDGGYKVVLTGEGADEILGGYDIFKEAKVRRFWATQPESTFRATLLKRLYPYLPNMQAQSLAYHKAFFHARGEDLDNPLFSHLPRWEMTSRLKMFCSAETQAAMRRYDAYADCLSLLPDDFAMWPPFCQAQFLETATLLPGYILSSQGDRMAMAHSVEGRFPFLDHRVAELAARVPPRLKMCGLDEKHLLKRATRHLVPEAVAKRTKQPYRAPDATCFFGKDNSPGSMPEYAETLLSPRRIAEDGLFHAETVERLVRKARRGDAIGFKDNMALVGILSTQLLVEQYVRHFAPPTEHILDEMEEHDPLNVFGDAATPAASTTLTT